MKRDGAGRSSRDREQGFLGSPPLWGTLLPNMNNTSHQLSSPIKQKENESILQPHVSQKGVTRYLED